MSYVYTYAYLQHGRRDQLPEHVRRDCYVYTYAYPDGAVFYVGKGKRYRYKEHIWIARSGPATKYSPCTCAPIQQVWRDGGEVICSIVAIHLTEVEAFRLESRLIREYTPTGKLVNRVRGLLVC